MHMQSVLQGVHAQGNVHSRAVGEEGSQSCLHKQAEDKDPVPVEQKMTRNQRQTKVRTIKVQTNAKMFKMIEIITEAKLQLSC